MDQLFGLQHRSRTDPVIPLRQFCGLSNICEIQTFERKDRVTAGTGYNVTYPGIENGSQSASVFLFKNLEMRIKNTIFAHK